VIKEIPIAPHWHGHEREQVSDSHLPLSIRGGARGTCPWCSARILSGAGC